MNWDWDHLTDVLGLFLIFCGSLLCLTAAIGLLRFRDLLTRMHAGTKPQALGVLVVLTGVALSKEGGLHLGMLLLVAAFQMLTIPVGAHMAARAGFRTGQVAPSDVHLGPPTDHADPDSLVVGRDASDGTAVEPDTEIVGRDASDGAAPDPD